MPTYSYSGNPAASDKDWIRFRSADTDVSGGSASADFSDEEIAAILAEHAGDRWRATHSLMRKRLQNYLRLALNAGSSELDAIVTSSKAAIDNFMAEAAAQGISITLPAASASGKSLLTGDSDAIQPRFTRGQHEFSSLSVPFSTLDD